MITKTWLRKRAELYAQIVGRPVELSIWSPGDGWTRYQLIDTRNGSTIGHTCNGRTMDSVLSALIYEATFAKQSR